MYGANITRNAVSWRVTATMVLSTRYLFKHCYGRYGIPAVNVEFMEQVHGLFAAAQQAAAPFIVQTTPAARDYAGADMLLAMIRSAASIYPNTVFAIHLDHGFEDHIHHAVASGEYSSVMIDASHDPFDRNIARTRAVVALAHDKSIAVEAELGILSGIEDTISIEEQSARYTDPDEAKKFVEATNCDSLAVAVGTSHGAYKFSGGQGLRLDILQEIQRRLPGYPLVLHGGSMVDAGEIERINLAGGQLSANANGVNPDQLAEAIKLGICKVNIATDTRLLWVRVIREFTRDHPQEFAPMIPGKIYMDEYKEFMMGKFEMLGAAGKANDLLASNVLKQISQ